MKFIVSAQLKNWGTYRLEIEANSPKEAEEKFRATARFEVTSVPNVRTVEQEKEGIENTIKWQEDGE